MSDDDDDGAEALAALAGTPEGREAALTMLAHRRHSLGDPPESVVARLVEMGFAEEEARRAVQEAYDEAAGRADVAAPGSSMTQQGPSAEVASASPVLAAVFALIAVGVVSAALGWLVATMMGTLVQNPAGAKAGAGASRGLWGLLLVFFLPAVAPAIWIGGTWIAAAAAAGTAGSASGKAAATLGTFGGALVGLYVNWNTWANQLVESLVSAATFRPVDLPYEWLSPGDIWDGAGAFASELGWTWLGIDWSGGLLWTMWTIEAGLLVVGSALVTLGASAGGDTAPGPGT